MKRQALYFTAPHQVTVREEPLSEPGAGQFLAQSVLSAVSPGTELLVYRGQAPKEMAVDETISALGGEFDFPLKYGYATVGRVIALGPQVASEWDRRLVFAFQPHQSHFVTTPDAVLPLPAGISPEQAALLPTMETAVNFLMDGQPLVGEQVVVFGQGIVGLLTTSLLARFPLGRLISVDRFALRREHSIELGAQRSLDSDAPDVTDQLRMALRDGQRDRGADLAYELSGNPAALDLAVAATGFDGRVIIGSWYGQKRSAIDLGGRFHRSRIRLISSQVSTIAPALRGRWTKTRRFEVAWEMLQHEPDVRLTKLITHRFPLHQAAQAYALLDQHPQDVLQTVLTYDDCC